MISSNSREKGFDQAKQEGDTNESSKLISKQPPSSSSRQWSGFRNPRIVRVSRSFGGKDRHSKVCTIRGLRDRRIRLSVPTAIQLYDLQNRLGLSQPSKVIDWLLDVTKLDIDKLPPLQIPPGLFGHHHQFHNNQQQQQQPMMTQSIDHGDHQDDQSNKYWDLEASSSLNMRAKGKEVENTLPLLNPYYYHWDPSQFGSGHEFVSHQQADDQNAFPSGSHNHHLFFCPPAAATMPSLFPTYAPTYAINAQDGTHDHSSRQLINHLQLFSSSSSSSQQVKPFSLNVNLGYAESNPDKEDT